MTGLRLRQLEEYLQQLDVFENPKVTLEQYATSAHIAAHLLYTAQSQFDDIKGKSVADLGSGCGTLSLGAKMLDAEYVVGFEIDSEAVDIQYRNCSDIELFVEVVQCDVLQYLPGIYISIYMYVTVKINFNKCILRLRRQVPISAINLQFVDLDSISSVPTYAIFRVLRNQK